MTDRPPFVTTRRIASSTGTLSLVVEDAPAHLAVPANWTCERLSLVQLTVGNQLSDRSAAGHVLTNSPSGLVQAYVKERWWHADYFGEFARSKPGWTTPEELLRWAEQHPAVRSQFAARARYGLPVQHLYSFHCDGMMGHVSIAREAVFTPEERAVIEFAGPSLFSAFLTFARMQMKVSVTARESEIIELTSLGLSSQRIANELKLSPHTVASHIRQAQHKLGARNRVHLVTEAIRHGLLDNYGFETRALPRPVAPTGDARRKY